MMARRMSSFFSKKNTDADPPPSSATTGVADQHQHQHPHDVAEDGAARTAVGARSATQHTSQTLALLPLPFSLDEGTHLRLTIYSWLVAAVLFGHLGFKWGWQWVQVG